MEHHKENIRHIEIRDINSLENSMALKEKSFDELSNNIRDIEAKLILFKENVEKNEEVIKKFR